MKRRCLGKCGRLITSGSYCPACVPATAWGNRDRAAQAKFRRLVLARDGHQCTEVVNGVRCSAKEDLRACHLTPVHAGGSNDPSNGTTRCGPHDRATDKWAR